MKIAYVLGDNLFEEMKDIREKGLPPHLDSDNSEVTVADHALDLIEKGDKPVVSANAYLGAREIVKGLEQGADIIIAGRVADASPVRTTCIWSCSFQLMFRLGYWRSLVLVLLAGYRL